MKFLPALLLSFVFAGDLEEYNLVGFLSIKELAWQVLSTVPITTIKSLACASTKTRELVENPKFATLVSNQFLSFCHKLTRRDLQSFLPFLNRSLEASPTVPDALIPAYGRVISSSMDLKTVLALQVPLCLKMTTKQRRKLLDALIYSISDAEIINEGLSLSEMDFQPSLSPVLFIKSLYITSQFLIPIFISLFISSEFEDRILLLNWVIHSTTKELGLVAQVSLLVQEHFSEFWNKHLRIVRLMKAVFEEALQTSDVSDKRLDMDKYEEYFGLDFDDELNFDSFVLEPERFRLMMCAMPASCLYQIIEINEFENKVFLEKMLRAFSVIYGNLDYEFDGQKISIVYAHYSVEQLDDDELKLLEVFQFMSGERCSVPPKAFNEPTKKWFMEHIVQVNEDRRLLRDLGPDFGAIDKLRLFLINSEKSKAFLAILKFFNPFTRNDDLWTVIFDLALERSPGLAKNATNEEQAKFRELWTNWNFINFLQMHKENNLLAPLQYEEFMN